MTAGHRAVHALLLAAALLCGTAHAGVLGIMRLSTTVSDLPRSVAFYRNGLGFKLERYEQRSGDDFSRLMGLPDAQARVAVLRLGREEVELMQYTAPGRPMPADSKSTDLWFQHMAIVVSNMGKAYAHLRRVRFRPISLGGPQKLPPNTGSVRAFKFRDPDGHPLELIYFPRGTGRAVWRHGAKSALFMGIDHSAIDISDTAASREFYGDLLGMSVAYESTNTGSAQERLDGTANALVRITGMRAGTAGMGLEFLDYRTPRDGRPAAADEAGNDIEHTHLLLRVDALDALVASLNQAGMHEVFPQPVAFGAGQRAILVRDPDLHEMMLVGR
jgi:catechol 2,3-dioxygenase-like lactoylglutathione lyase family enzyme